MQINIIHLTNRIDRWEVLQKELYHENIIDFEVWNGIVDTSITARGISQAHKQIVKYAREMELPEVLIAEDDLKFTSKGAYQFFLRNKPIDYDLYLSSIYYGELEVDNTVTDFSGLTFYVVNQRFYDKLLSMPEHDNLDRTLRGKGKFVVCNPFTVIQYNGFSDNIKQYCNYDSYLKDRKFFGKSNF